MPYTLDQIKAFLTVDLDNFEIRGAKTGINNARSTGPLYTRGVYEPSKTILTGSATFTPSSTTVSGISFDAPFSGLDAYALTAGDTINVGSDSFSIVSILSSTSAEVDPAPSLSGTQSATYRFADRDYLIEPDVLNNTVTGLATFTNGSPYVVGSGSQWTIELAAGDSIQLNSYQKYFIVKTIINDTNLELESDFSGDTTTGFYTAKRWRLNRLLYQYVKNDFTYNKTDSVWEYDATTGSGYTATDYFASFQDGIEIKFSPTLNPNDYPDVMDSNLALNKTLTKKTENDMNQYSLPVVPRPEESLTLYINDIEKDMFPDGNMDYVLNYSQDPIYRYPPPDEERKVANVMFLRDVQNVTLDPADTEAGVITFTDANGNPVSGVMPGSETVWFNGTDQTAYKDYVLDIDAGVGYATGLVTNEPVVKYVAYEPSDLYSYGLTISLDGTNQNFTIPRNEEDEVIFDQESGRLRPANSDNPGPGEEYIVNYMIAGEYVSDEAVTITAGMTSFRLSRFPVMYQSVILQKNGEFIDEYVDYRVSYLTGRVVLFETLVRGDSILVHYNPLLRYKNGITYENDIWYTKVYDSTSAVANVDPPEFYLTNTALSDNESLEVLSIYNVTKAKQYDITDYVLRGTLVHLQPNTTNRSFETALSDVVVMDYKFENEGTEYAPVETIRYHIEENQDYLAFIDQDRTSNFPAGTIIRLTNVDTAGNYFFRTTSSTYDGEDTVVDLDGAIPVEINNPYIYASDDPLEFNSIDYTAEVFLSGGTDLYFSNNNISHMFRTGSMLRINDDYYYVSEADYDSSANRTTVSVSVPAYYDYTSASTLTTMEVSDVPLYYEGDTAISTAKALLAVDAPAMALTYDGLALFTCDSTAFAVDVGSVQYSFPYSTYTTVSDLATALNGIDVTAITFVTDWTSSKIIPQRDVTITADSSSLVTIDPALRYQGVDTNQFDIGVEGIVLNNELVVYDRYNLDYMGQEYLGDTTVSFSASYFSYLPARSKISASFKFNNLDQFYIQTTSQRNFLEAVIEPAMKERAVQQSGSVGQGGEVAGDEDAGNSSGGLEHDEFRRADTAIECRVMNNIFDFFNARLQAFTDEYYAAFGYKICNNDGLLSEADQSAGTKSLNRMFPWADYTDMPPYKIACLTGQAIPWAYPNPTLPPVGQAIFTNGSPTVDCTSTDFGYPSYFTYQLNAGDFVRPLDTTKEYEIQSVGSNRQLTLTSNYDGSSSPLQGVPFAITAKLPLYDDDAHMGGKLKGNKSSNFGLANGDVFDATVDGAYQSYTFMDSTDPFLAQMFPVSSFNASTIAQLLSSNLPDVRSTAEWIIDNNTAYGFKEAIIVRTESTKNKITLGTGNAVTKLGFSPGSSSFGNFNTTDSNPEQPNTTAEQSDLATEQTALSNLVAAGIPNKLNRVTPANLVNAYNIYNACADEVIRITREIDRITIEQAATALIIQEPSMPSYTQTLAAYLTDTTFLGECPAALSYAQSISTNWEGKNTAARWVLDITQDTQNVRGKDSSNIAVPVDSGAGITPIVGETNFTLEIDSTYDQRFLNATVDSTGYYPVVKFLDNNVTVDGSFTGWDPSVGNQYSLNNQVTFWINTANPLFVLDSSNSAFSFETSGSALTMKWDVSYNKAYNYSSYPTVGSLKTAISGLAGLAVSGSAVHDGTSSFNIDATSETPLSPSVNVNKKSVGLFNIFQDSTRNYNYSVDNTALNLYYPAGPQTWTLLFATYQTVGTMKTQVDSIPGLGVSGASYHDGTSSEVFKPVSTTAIGGFGATIYDQTYSLFTITADHAYSLSYFIDKTGLDITWDSGNNKYAYSSYSTVGSMKSAINADIPGVKAVGSATHDSSNPEGFKLIGTTSIPPDASVYPGLRDCYATYDTISDELLLERQAFVNTRKANVDARVTFLGTRQGQIEQHILDEEYFRATDGNTGNIYNWADNRFNRATGCEARLKQIEKIIEVNQSALNISRRFL